MAEFIQVVVYCDVRAVASEVHWKQEVPDLAAEVLRDFHLLAVQGAKRVYHCLVEKTGQLGRIADWITTYNEGETDANKIWYWTGDTVDEVFTALWQDADPFAHAIAERVLRYPVTVGSELRIVTVYDAINTYGATIVPAVLKQYGAPHRFFGVG